MKVADLVRRGRRLLHAVAEEAGLRRELSEWSVRLEGLGTQATQLAAARTALETLGTQLQEPLSWEARRQLCRRV